MFKQKNQLLINSFLDSAIALVPEEMLNRRLTRIVAQAFYLGVIDFLVQAESLSDRDFHTLIEKTFDRYKVPLQIPAKEYLLAVAKNAGSAPLFEEAMYKGAEAFRSFWTKKDTTAPSELARLILSIDDLNDDYERKAKEHFGE